MSGLPAALPWVRHCRIAADHPAFAGHFPGQPILPGVALLAEVLEAWREFAPAGTAAGALQLGAAKFLAPVGPGAELRIELSPEARQWRFAVYQGQQLAASGSFAAEAAP